VYDRNRLGQMILEHWKKYRPQMVEDLQRANQLDQAIYEVQERTGDLLYELVSIQKMDYQGAWEVATQEWLSCRARTDRSHPPWPRRRRAANRPLPRFPNHAGAPDR